MRHFTFRYFSSQSSSKVVREPSRSNSRVVREYFYEINSFGQLFLKETKYKNFTSCFKDEKFLKFFYSRLMKNSISNNYFNQGYQWISPCGIEMNYVMVEDVPLVYTTLTTTIISDTHSDERTSKALLGWPGSGEKTVFDPSKITLDQETGRLYHPLPASCADRFRGTLGLLESRMVMREFASSLQDDCFIWNGVAYPLTLHRNSS